jgi:hypothetical protein
MTETERGVSHSATAERKFWIQMGFNGIATGDSILDFLTGTLSSFQQSLPQQPTVRMTIPALYAQDTIHATQNLTINAGAPEIQEPR